MKPILIIEHIESSGPGLFEAFIKEKSIPYTIIRPNNGDSIPGQTDIAHYSGVSVCGGIESVLEPTDWMHDEIRLIKSTREKEIPVIGHCLGGQLICKALGGEVTKHEQEEFGWSRLHINENNMSREWLEGAPSELCAMQWHSDTFSIPDGAKLILTGDHCTNQAFIYKNMLAMQFHVEVDIETINHWAIDLSDKHPPASKSVQTSEQIIDGRDKNFAVSRQLANVLYSKWINGMFK